MTRAQLRMGKMEFKERMKLEVWRLEGLTGLRREKFLEEMGGAGGNVPAKWKVKFPSNFLPAWIEEEMGEHGGLWSEPGKGRFSGGHARAA